MYIHVHVHAHSTILRLTRHKYWWAHVISEARFGRLYGLGHLWRDANSARSHHGVERVGVVVVRREGVGEEGGLG